MDELLAPIQDVMEGPIDFHGQHLAEILSNVLLIISGVVSFVAGFIYKDLHLTLWLGLTGTLFTGFVVIPPWPIYNRNPEKWLAPTSGKPGGPKVIVNGVKVA